GGRRTALAGPPGGAYGTARAEPAIAVRDPDHSPATASGLGIIDANAPKRASRTVARPAAPNAPSRGSAMTSSRRARGNGGSRPSAASASPSRCSIPVSAASAIRAIAAAAGGGHARRAPHQTAPTPSPMSGPTTGNQASADGAGSAAPPNGVRKDRARRISVPPGSRAAASGRPRRAGPRRPRPRPTG